MLQLHVWGPGFGLPSIDPQCLAAIAYLSQFVSKNEWELVASSDLTLSPTRELPALRDGSIWIGGFQNILHHLQRKSGGLWDLDHDCNDRDEADIFAYTSFIEAHGQPLIDLSLYVSSENYYASTRPAYSHLLRWPQTWLLPPKRRAAAKARTDHLNLSSLDLDTWNGEEANETQFAAGTEIPKLARLTQQRVSSLVRQPQHATRFRLNALAKTFLEPLAHLLQGQRYLLHGDQMRSLDCLALGYLSLALFPEVPQSWLSQSMKSSYQPLCRYVETLAQVCFGDILPTKDRPGSEGMTGRTLPWKDPRTDSIEVSIRIRSSLESLPYVGALYHPTPLQQSTTTSHDHLSRVPVLPTMFSGLAASVTALASYVLYTGEIPPLLHHLNWPSLGRQRSPRLVDLGEAGAMLGAVRFRP
ncbi:MAG: hypothetical protein L6R35_003436 [Caloplaca aegaea]|nr:MAG: hypothetical protein L6R35_003436 [Caloplaca aegaea]